MFHRLSLNCPLLIFVAGRYISADDVTLQSNRPRLQFLKQERSLRASRRGRAMVPGSRTDRWCSVSSITTAEYSNQLYHFCFLPLPRSLEDDEMSPSRSITATQNREGPLAVEPEFEDFWKRYPMRKGKREGKKKALKKWINLNAEDRSKYTIWRKFNCLDITFT